MNPSVFLLFTICFFANYCHGMEKDESNEKDRLKKTPRPSKGEKNLKKSDAAKIAHNAKSSKAVEKAPTKEMKLCFENVVTNFKLNAFHGETILANWSETVQEKRIMNDGKETIWQCVKITESFWDGLAEKEEITFKKDRDEIKKKFFKSKKEKEKVLGSATVGTLSFVNEATEQNGWPNYLEFTVERRDYYHFLHEEMLSVLPRVIILYKMNNIIFLFYKKVKLTFKKGASFRVQAFRDNTETPFYSDKTQTEIQYGKEGKQYVLMPVDGIEWNGLDDKEKITFKDGEGKVLGTATAQVLIITSTVWLHFDNNYEYYYRTGGVYYNGDGVDGGKWDSATLLKYLK